MSTLADVIPFSLRQSGCVKQSYFSVKDETMLSGLLCVLTDEMNSRDINFEARMRLYFYLGLHNYAMQRWVRMLSRRHTLHNQQLGQQIAGSFQYLTSSSILEEDIQDYDTYRGKVALLSKSLRLLLQLISSC